MCIVKLRGGNLIRFNAKGISYYIRQYTSPPTSVFSFNFPEKQKPTIGERNQIKVDCVLWLLLVLSCGTHYVLFHIIPPRIRVIRNIVPRNERHPHLLNLFPFVLCQSFNPLRFLLAG